MEKGPHAFEMETLEPKLRSAVGHTLGEVDQADVFYKVDKSRNTKAKDLIKGIAGDVVEQSVLGYPADSDQRPDLIIDGVATELKTTGLRPSKIDAGYEAKEPMSITAVSLDSIAREEFETSHFWQKAQRMLLLYYFYDDQKTVRSEKGKVLSISYARFMVLGYQLHEFSRAEIETLKNDWQIVHDYVEHLQRTATSEQELKEGYSRLSSALRPKLMMIDTSPKYPNPPRFRLKRAVVTLIARKMDFIKSGKLQTLPIAYTSFDAIDRKLHELAAMYSGMNGAQIAERLGVELSPGKNAAEALFVAMFGGSGKINNIDLFVEAGIVVKTARVRKSGMPDQDTKFYAIDLNDYSDSNLTFEESDLFHYFGDSQFVFMVFETPYAKAPLSKCKFIGFKRFVLPENRIAGELRSCFSTTLDLVANKKVEFVPEIDRSTGEPKINKSGTIKGAPNFPKSSDCQIFIKGSGQDATARKEFLPGVPMYQQYVWWGKKLTRKLLDATSYL